MGRDRGERGVREVNPWRLGPLWANHLVTWDLVHPLSSTYHHLSSGVFPTVWPTRVGRRLGLARGLALARTAFLVDGGVEGTQQC